MTLVKLPYVKIYRDRHGKVRHYFHRRGQRDVPLLGLVGSEQFMRAYQAALNSRERSVSPHGAGTFARLLEDYYRSVEFTNLKPSSKKAYRLCLDPIAQRDGHRLVRDMPRDKVRKIIEEIGATRPAMANLTAKVLRALLGYAVDNGWRTDNPASQLKLYRLGTHHAWTDAQLAAFETHWPLGTRERLAYSLLLYLGQRVGDTARMRRRDIVDGFIQVTQEKTGAELSIPIHPKLYEALKAGPANGLHHLIGDQYGRQISGSALSAFMIRAAKEAGLGPECVPHGLRKAVLRRIAEHGGSAKEIASVSGHRSLTEVARYTEQADQRRLSQAAIRKISDGSGTDTV
jgi:integrase